MNRLLLMLVMLLAWQVPVSSANEKKPLSGHVKTESAVRIPRPHALSGTAVPLKTGIESNDFDIGAKKMSLSGQSETALSEPIVIPVPSFTSSMRKAADPVPAPAASQGSGEAKPNYDYGAKAKVDFKKIVIRLKRFRASGEMEVVWEASRMGNRMLHKGADVTILLDMEGVHAADKNDTAGAYNESNRGNGNSRAERLTSPQQHLSEFAGNGGHIVASARWVKLFAISIGALIPGTTLASEDEIDDILLDPNTTVIDY